ncbi:Magnesium transporter MgtE [Candidatus Magnetaquicoccaceae bacterium FCR-1]|uniref:Magnesium transporter MgtE n=1 Tax=Candidatus Magnetaquiglobus chichijimensis TaxID=3141448 RepID=A0ABQ0CA40_9PROT
MAMMVLDDNKAAAKPAPKNSNIAEAIVRLHRRGATAHLTQLLSKLKPSDLGEVLNGFPGPRAMELFCRIAPPEHAAQVLTELDDDHRRYVVSNCPGEQIRTILDTLPPEVRQMALTGLDPEVAERLSKIVNRFEKSSGDGDEIIYTPGTAGSLMETNIIAMSDQTTAGDAILAIQALSSHDAIFYLYVLDDMQRLIGVCSLRRLIVADPKKTLREFTQTRLIKVHVDTPQGTVANLISRYRLLAMPVVDEFDVLVGQITIDNLIEIIQEENTNSILKMAGIGSKDTNVLAQSPFKIFRTRVPWLITAFIAYILVSAILEGFEQTLEKVVQLAFFFPIVIGMSGNAGSQTGAVVVRGLALGTIHNAHFFRLLFKELGINIIQGAVYGLCLAGASYLIFQNPLLSVTLGIAMTLSITCSAAIAMSLPFFFKRLGADPAVAAGPLALAFIDMVGSINYLTVAFMVFKL